MNPFIKGIAFGAAAPLAAYILTGPLQLVLLKPYLFYVLAGLANLLLIRYFYQRSHESMARGITLATFVALLVLLIATKFKL